MKTIAIILFVAIVALSTTLVTGRVFAEDCTVICLSTAPQHVNPPVNITGFFKDPVGQATVEHQIYGNSNITAQTDAANLLPMVCKADKAIVEKEVQLIGSVAQSVIDKYNEQCASIAGRIS